MQEMQRRQREQQKFHDLIKEGAGKTVEERVDYNKDLEYNKHANLFAISYSTIHKAACDGSVNGIKYFMQLKSKPRIRIDDQDKFGICPIHYAAERGYDAAISTMLSFDCPVDVLSTDGMTAMMYASKGGRTQTMQLLFDHKADLQATNRSGMSIAHFAAPNDFVDVFELLVVLNRRQKELIMAQIEEAEINGENAGAGKPSATSSAKAKAAAPPPTSTTSSSAAAAAKGQGKPKPADSDSDDDDDDDDEGKGKSGPDLGAADGGGGPPPDEDVTEAEMLRLKYRAMLNLPDSSIIDVPSRNRTRPLHVAAAYNAVRTVEFLLAHGAEANAVDSAGETPLHKAARKNNFDAYRAIARSGGRDDVKNTARETPKDLLCDKTNV